MSEQDEPTFGEKLMNYYIKKAGLDAALVAFLADLIGEGITIDGEPITPEQAAIAVTWIVGEQ